MGSDQPASVYLSSHFAPSANPILTLDIGFQNDFGDDGSQGAGIYVRTDPFGRGGSDGQFDNWIHILIQVPSNMLMSTIHSSDLSLFRFSFPIN
jgi:hypothetical protein